MRNFTWNRFPIKNLLIDTLLTPIVESTYLNRDMCKFESSQKDESRWQSTDSSKAYRNISAFKCPMSIKLWDQFLFLINNCLWNEETASVFNYNLTRHYCTFKYGFCNLFPVRHSETHWYLLEQGNSPMLALFCRLLGSVLQQLVCTKEIFRYYFWTFVMKNVRTSWNNTGKKHSINFFRKTWNVSFPSLLLFLCSLTISNARHQHIC